MGIFHAVAAFVYLISVSSVHGRSTVTRLAGWSGWSTDGQCSVTCGVGSIKRTRQCIGDLDRCVGKTVLYKRCYAGCCPENCPKSIGWGEWSSWSTCSSEKCSLTKGYHTRMRSCKSRSPNESCEGNRTETRPCIDLDGCEVEGVYSQWSSWMPCTPPCGECSTKIRDRICQRSLNISSVDIIGRYNIICKDIEEKPCFVKPCSDGTNGCQDSLLTNDENDDNNNAVDEHGEEDDYDISTGSDENDYFAKKYYYNEADHHSEDDNFNDENDYSEEDDSSEDFEFSDWSENQPYHINEEEPLYYSDENHSGEEDGPDTANNEINIDYDFSDFFNPRKQNVVTISHSLELSPDKDDEFTTYGTNSHDDNSAMPDDFSNNDNDKKQCDWFDIEWENPEEATRCCKVLDDWNNTMSDNDRTMPILTEIGDEESDTIDNYHYSDTEQNYEMDDYISDNSLQLTRSDDPSDFGNCLSLYLEYSSERIYGQLKERGFGPKTCHIHKSTKLVRTVCCSYRQCSGWANAKIAGLCRACHRQNKCQCSGVPLSG